jgi:pimeloyl-ACP methyl ester carboxylesterase
MRLRRAGVALLAALSVLLSSDPPAAVAAGPVDQTSAAERRRVDRVPAPKIRWYKCADIDRGECAIVPLPRDYDNPRAGTTNLGVFRVRARKPAQRIGSLFVNPGGPGGSSVDLAAGADGWLSGGVLDRFDVVGIDPRGIGRSDNVKCFPSPREQTRAMAGMDVPFPVGAAEAARFIGGASRVAKACSAAGNKLIRRMSTADVARDMDVLRRALGDKKLTFLGFSYGTALGQYYANMFPDRVRAIVVDGVINPVSWVGTAATGGQILDERLHSADGAYKAIRELMRRCATVSTALCPLAGGTVSPQAKYDSVIKRLKAKPIAIPAEGDEPPFTLGYAGFVSGTLSALYSPDGLSAIVRMTAALYNASSANARELSAAVRAVRKWAKGPARGFPYDNSFEAYSGVTCTDARHPKRAADWPALVAKADRRAPDFGPAWAWSTVQCATGVWTAQDTTAYRGPFNRRTSAPVLVVGDYYDPATNYAEAVSASRLLPNARLLSSDSWGHTAYGTSACVTGAVDAYLLSGALPKAGTVCKGDVQPFTGEPAGTLAASRDILPGRPKPSVARKLPPVVIPPQFRNW